MRTFFSILFNIILILLVGASMFFLKDDAIDFIQNIRHKFSEVQEEGTLSIADEIRSKLTKKNLPGPLRGKDGEDSSKELTSVLNIHEIISETNRHRTAEGLSPLTENTKLNMSAKIKADDMLALQYFEHVAPDGTDIGDLGDQVGYIYITIGENLALGGFLDSADVVQAWMNSPGHRANILNEDYQEIGIGIARGEYEGRVQWLAVQHFGTPRSACPEIDENLKIQIETNQEDLTRRSAEIEESEKDIENTNKLSPGYNKKVERHNKLIDEYNTLLEATKVLLRTYNGQVQEFNSCIKSK